MNLCFALIRLATHQSVSLGSLSLFGSVREISISPHLLQSEYLVKCEPCWTFEADINTCLKSYLKSFVWCCASCAGPWFSVEGKNEERGISGLSYLRKLYVTVNGITVTMMKTRKTLVSVGTPPPIPTSSITLSLLLILV